MLFGFLGSLLRVMASLGAAIVFGGAVAGVLWLYVVGDSPTGGRDQLYRLVPCAMVLAIAALTIAGVVFGMQYGEKKRRRASS